MGEPKAKYWISLAHNFHGDISFSRRIIDEHPLAWKKRQEGPPYYDLLSWVKLTSEDLVHLKTFQDEEE